MAMAPGTLRLLQRGLYVLGLGSLVVGAWALGRMSTASQSTPPVPASTSQAPVTAPPVASASAQATVTLSTPGWYHGRSDIGPLDDQMTEGVLLSTSSDECTEGCPKGLRFESGPPADAARQAALASLDAPLHALLAAEDLPREIREAIARTYGNQVAAAIATPADRRGLPHRVMSIGMRRPDQGPDRFFVALASYTHCDPHFDAKRTELCPEGGGHLLIVRFERAHEGKPTGGVVAGFLEVEEKPKGGAEPIPPTPDAGLLYVMAGPVYTHFSINRGPVHGLILRSDGNVLLFGPTPVPREFEPSPALRAALIRVLGSA